MIKHAAHLPFEVTRYRKEKEVYNNYPSVGKLYLFSKSRKRKYQTCSFLREYKRL